MKKALEQFYEFLARPVFMSSRLVLVVLVIPLLLSFTQPLWHIRMTAPQYPKGLDLYIHAHKLEGGNSGHDIQEINTLNHYIGMRPIDRAALNDLDWIPFAFGLLAILCLRVAAVGNVRSLVDLAVITGYVSAFGLGRFWYKLHVFGHELSPEAPFKIDPFMPVLWGKKQIANFHTEAGPAAGSYLVGAYAVGVLAVLAWHLIAGRRQARARVTTV